MLVVCLICSRRIQWEQVMRKHHSMKQSPIPIVTKIMSPNVMWRGGIGSEGKQKVSGRSIQFTAWLDNRIVNNLTRGCLSIHICIWSFESWNKSEKIGHHVKRYHYLPGIVTEEEGLWLKSEKLDGFRVNSSAFCLRSWRPVTPTENNLPTSLSDLGILNLLLLLLLFLDRTESNLCPGFFRGPLSSWTAGDQIVRSVSRQVYLDSCKV